jgi:hypothetical protein
MDRSIELCHVYCSHPFTVGILIGPLQRHLLAPPPPPFLCDESISREKSPLSVYVSRHVHNSHYFFPSFLGQLFSAARRRCDRKAARWCRCHKRPQREKVSLHCKLEECTHWHRFIRITKGALLFPLTG